MKLPLIALAVACCGCLASAGEAENKVQKRSISDGWDSIYGGSYGLSSAALAAPSISTLSLAAPSISSHTHTHSTAVIDRPYPVAIKSPIIAPTYNYGLGSTYGSYGSYGLSSLGSYGSYGSYPYNFGYNSQWQPSYNKFYTPSYPTVYKKSYSIPTVYKKTYSYPLKYKW